VVLSVFCLNTAKAQVQEYSYSGPVTGLSDVYPNGGWGGFSVQFESVNETFFYNPQADTIEEKGAVTCNTSGGSFNIYLDEGGATPNPDPVIGTATVTIGNGDGTWSFDHVYSLGQPFGDFGAMFMPVTGTETLNGQTYQGTWSYDIGSFLAEFQVTPNGLEVNEYVQGEENGGPPLGSFAGDSAPGGPPHAEWIEEITALPVPDSTPLFGEVPLLVLFGGAAWRKLGRRPPVRRPFRSE
jgi:hypothetical protein